MAPVATVVSRVAIKFFPLDHALDRPPADAKCLRCLVYVDRVVGGRRGGVLGRNCFGGCHVATSSPRVGRSCCRYAASVLYDTRHDSRVACRKEAATRRADRRRPKPGRTADARRCARPGAPPARLCDAAFWRRSLDPGGPRASGRSRVFERRQDVAGRDTSRHLGARSTRARRRGRRRSSPPRPGGRRGRGLDARPHPGRGQGDVRLGLRLRPSGSAMSCSPSTPPHPKVRVLQGLRQWSQPGSNRRPPACKVFGGVNHCASHRVVGHKFRDFRPWRASHEVTVCRKCLFPALTLATTRRQLGSELAHLSFRAYRSPWRLPRFSALPRSSGKPRDTHWRGRLRADQRDR